MTVPRPRVEVLFGVNASLGDEYFVVDDPERGELNNTSFVLAPTGLWVDVTDDVLLDAGVRWSRGRRRVLDEISAGTGGFSLKNLSRRYDPTNTDSDLHGSLKPMRRVRFLADLRDGTNVPVAGGFVEDFPVELRTNVSWVPVSTVGVLAAVAATELDREETPVDGGQLSGQRVATVLDRPEVGYTFDRQIDDGLSVFGPTEYGSGTLDYLQTCARSENGRLFENRDGAVAFRDRHRTLSVQPKVTFCSGDSTVAGVPFVDVSFDTSAELIRNRVVASGVSGNEIVRTDDSSRAEYLTRTLKRRDLLLESDGDVEQMAEYLLGRFGTDHAGFRSVAVELAGLGVADQLRVLRLDVSDVVEINLVPPGDGSPAELSGVAVVEGVSDVCASGSWIRRFDLSPADSRAFVRLDDVTFGVLNVNRVAY